MFLTRRSQKDHMRKNRPVTTPQAQSRSLIQDCQMTLIKRGSTTVFLFLFLFIVGSLPSAAQDVPRIEVFGGYSYLRFDSRSFGFAGSSNLNGYNLAPAFNIFHGFGVVGELSGQYGSHLNLRDVAVGPQILYPRNNLIFFAHVMYGDARTHVSVGNGPGDTARVIVAGAALICITLPGSLSAWYRLIICVRVYFMARKTTSESPLGWYTTGVRSRKRNTRCRARRPRGMICIAPVSAVEGTS